jgi:hypothetical protein
MPDVLEANVCFKYFLSRLTLILLLKPLQWQEIKNVSYSANMILQAISKHVIHKKSVFQYLFEKSDILSLSLCIV